MPEIVKRHYNRLLWAGLDDGLPVSSRCVIAARRVADGLLGRFGQGRITHMRGASVVAPEGGGDALPAFEDPAEGGPTVAVRRGIGVLPSVAVKPLREYSFPTPTHDLMHYRSGADVAASTKPCL